MPIPVQQFPILSPEQMSPYGGLLKDVLQKFVTGVNAAYLPSEKATDLQKSIAETLMKQAEAKYAPQMQEAKLATERTYPGYYGAQTQNLLANTNRTNAMTPLEVDKQTILNKFLGQREQAEINNLNMGGGKYLNADQRNMNAFTKQLMVDNPKKAGENDQLYNQRINQLQSAYLAGQDTLPDGSPLPTLSGSAQQQYSYVTGHNAPVSVKNQAANYDMLYQDLNNFDIGTVKKFAGVRGKAMLADAMAKMQINPDDPSIDPDARKFLTSMQQSIYNMDTMRKAFGTSVVPEYVYKTIGKLSNPTSDIWNDPTQVEMNFNAIKDQVKKNRDLLFAKTKRGVTATLPEANPDDVFRKTNVGNAGAEALAKDIQLPSFNSKEEFNSWFHKQPKITQDAVKIALNRSKK